MSPFRSSRSLPGSASNQLAERRGLHYTTALKLVVRMCCEEWPADPAPWQDAQEWARVRQWRHHLHALETAARHCLSQLVWDGRQISDIAAEWQACPDADLSRLGSAILSGDYTTLAI